MMRFLFRFFVPDEFAARQWRAFLRLKGWKSFPPVFAAALAVSSAGSWIFFSAAKGSSSEDGLIVLLLQETLVMTVSLGVTILWWFRPSTRRTLIELRTTLVHPAVWVRSSFRPAQVLLFLLNLALLPVILFVGKIGDLGGKVLAPVLLIIIANIIQSWTNCRLVLAFFLRIKNSIIAAMLATTLLLISHFFLLFVLLIVLIDFDINSAESYVIMHGTVLLIYIVLYLLTNLRFTKAVERYAEYLIEKD